MLIAPCCEVIRFMKHFEIPLDIEDVTIDKVEFKENGEIIITVTSTVEGTYCHRCGQKIPIHTAMIARLRCVIYRF